MAKTLVKNPKYEPEKPEGRKNSKMIAVEIDNDKDIDKAIGDGRYTVTQVRGLYLDVRKKRAREKTPKRVWTLRIMHGYKDKEKQKPNIVERTIGFTVDKNRRELGGVSLTDARTTALLWAREIRGGGEVGKRARPRTSTSAVVTFRDAAEAVMKRDSSSWKSDVHRKQWRQTLESYAYPFIGNNPVADVSQDDIVGILEPIWTTKHATAKKLLSRIGIVIGWAVTKKLRADNPARDKDFAKNLLGKVDKSKKPHAAMPYAEAPAFMVELRRLDSVSALALEFTILTGVRTSETIEAKWYEVKGDVWTIPAARTKTGKKSGNAHVVPLSPAALAVLEKVKALSHGDYIFPSRFSHLSNMAMLECLRGLRTGMTVHGFRATFRTWASEQTDYPHEVCEAALDHAVSSSVVKAYRRTSFFDKRRDLLNDWADYCDGKEPAVAVDEVADLKAQLAKQAAQIDVLLQALAK